MVKFVAEVSSNHHADLARCLDFVDTAAQIGCDAVKFQLFRVRELFAPQILERSAKHRAREAWELPVRFLMPIAERCRQRRIQFYCTPFYRDAVAELEPLVDAYKISSYELLWTDLLAACARTRKPVILSTGMATWLEVDGAVHTLRSNGCDKLTLLHCVSNYPTSPGECNLAAIHSLRKRYRCDSGWSDHSASPAVLMRAVHRWRSDMIEFHLDLDGTGPEYAAGHCWLPARIAELIRDTHVGEQCDGTDDKQPVAGEADEALWRADPVDGLRPLQAVRDQWRLEDLVYAGEPNGQSAG